MTPDNPNTKYAALAQLAEQLTAAVARNEVGDELQKLLAQMAMALADTGQAVSELKGRVDEVAERERTRDMSQQSNRAEEAMRFFAQLSEENRERLVCSVETTTPDALIGDFAERVTKDLEGIFSWDVRPLLQAVLYWYDYPGLVDDKDEIVNRVATNLANLYTGDTTLAALLLKVDAANTDSIFMRQLKRLIRSRKTLGVTAKADMLVNRHEHIYSSATVSTDIRPVFGSNIETAPEHAVLIHNLIIGFIEGGATRKICIGLTTKEIVELSGVLTRAWTKDRTLRGQNPSYILPQI